MSDPAKNRFEARAIEEAAERFRVACNRLSRDLLPVVTQGLLSGPNCPRHPSGDIDVIRLANTACSITWAITDKFTDDGAAE